MTSETLKRYNSAIAYSGRNKYSRCGYLEKNFLQKFFLILFFVFSPYSWGNLLFESAKYKNLILYLDTLFNIFKNLNFKISDFLGTVFFALAKYFRNVKVDNSRGLWPKLTHHFSFRVMGKKFWDILWPFLPWTREYAAPAQ